MMWSGYLTPHTVGVVTVEAEDRHAALALAQLLRPDVTGVARTTMPLRAERLADVAEYERDGYRRLIRDLRGGA